jgi:predicted Zn-dependent protease
MSAARSRSVCLGFAVSCGAVMFGGASAPISLISVQDEIALGRQAQRDVSSKVPRLADRAAAAYIATIGRKLAARAEGPRYPYSFSIADYRELNAFALPGGPVWINRGAIEASANEAQLAGVIAHEIAHVANRHAAGQITKRLVANGLLGLLGAILGNGGSARTAQASAQFMTEGYILKFSRDDEREADAAGARMMRRAGWDPREMVAFMRTLRRLDDRKSGSAAVFLSSHPAAQERVDRLTSLVRAMRGGKRDSEEFRRVRARVRRMPPAHVMPTR